MLHIESIATDNIVGKADVQGESEDLQNQLNHVYSRKVCVGTGLFYFLTKIHMKKVFRGALCACVASFVLASCEPANLGGDDAPVVSNPDVFILCEGLYQANNADITAYRSDERQCTGEYYLKQNGQYLGDTGQDILCHNGHLYVSVYGSSYIAKLDLEGKELRRHTFSAEEGQPRYLAAEGEYLYVTLYSGQVAKMKASDLNVVDYAPVRKNPEDIVVYKNQLLVANSGWGYDNTVTIIDMDTFKPTATITVEWNPQQFVIVGDNVYLLANGQYDENWNCDYPVQSIDVAERTARTITNATHAVGHEGKLYLCNSVTDWTTYKTTNTFFTYDVSSGAVSAQSFLQGNTEEVTSNSIYMMELNPTNGDIYIGLAGNKFVSSGMVHRYNTDGQLVHRFDVQGANPSQAAFVER